MQGSTGFSTTMVLAVLIGTALAHPVAGQLGARPAEEWAVTLESGQRLERIDIERVVETVGLEPGEIVADIGAGTGIFSVSMARRVGPEGHVIGQEVDAGFLPIILSNARQSGVSNVSAVLGEFEDPKLPRNDIDVAFFHDVLHHIQERGRYLQALAPYMAPGSRIFVVDYDSNVEGVSHSDQPEMLISPREVAGWMSEAGFEVTQEWDLFDDRFVVEYTRRD